MYAIRVLEPTKSKGSCLKDYKVLLEYVDLFLEKVLGLLPNKEIDFTIHLMIGATLVY